MRILAIGDIVGENGLKKAGEVLPKLKQEKKIDFVIFLLYNVNTKVSPNQKNGLRGY